MMIVIFFIAIVLVFLFGLALPYVSNIGTYNVKANDKTNKKQLKFKLNVETEEELSNNNRYSADGKNGLKKRYVSKPNNNDPNEFDFDVDELIQEDQREQQRENLKFRQTLNSSKKKDAYLNDLA